MYARRNILIIINNNKKKIMMMVDLNFDYLYYMSYNYYLYILVLYN